MAGDRGARPDRRTAVRAAGGEAIPNMQVEGDALRVKSEPVARVAIPLSAAAILVGLLAEAIDKGLPELNVVLNDLANRVRSAVDAREAK